MARLARARRRLQIQDHGHEGPPVDSGAVYPMTAYVAVVPNRAQIADGSEAQPCRSDQKGGQRRGGGLSRHAYPEGGLFHPIALPLSSVPGRNL